MKFHLNCYLLTLIFMIAAGCNRASDGPVRYECSGKVTFNGEPVNLGYINFEPDSAAGNSGPGSSAKIEKGVYKTSPDKGVVGGPYRITVIGYDGKASDGLGDGQALFPEVLIQRDLPRERSQQDFNITDNDL